MEGPLLVGTVSDASAFVEFARRRDPEALPDLVELRLDLIPENEHKRCFDVCEQIERAGVGVIATIRLESEGGGWRKPDEQLRKGVFSLSLRCCSLVDVELHGKIAAEVAAEAASMGKRAVVSYHNLTTTPPVHELEQVVASCFRAGASIAKIATMVTRREHAYVLIELLRRTSESAGPVCVIGMGASGLPLRLFLPTLGSHMAYAYLDRPAAPGQLGLSEMMRSLRVQIPAFNARYLARTKSLMGA